MISAEMYTKLAEIKVLALDVDGVMTDGTVTYIKGTGWTRTFSVKDGYGLKLLMKAGLVLGIISGGDSKSVRERAEILNIPHVYLGNENKVAPYNRIKEIEKVSDEQVAFVGDELFDIPVLEKVGFAATVPHAVYEVKSVVDYITREPGGAGAVREIADMIRYAHDGKTYNEYKEIFNSGNIS